jgi:hypothetical protein
LSCPHFGEGFRGSLGVAEIDRSREELLGAVDAARSQQFLRADKAQQVALFGSDQVLPALTSS